MPTRHRRHWFANSGCTLRRRVARSGIADMADSHIRSALYHSRRERYANQAERRSNGTAAVKERFGAIGRYADGVHPTL